MRSQVKPVPQNPPIRQIQDLSSATECTGLTPAAIRSQSDADSYAELYAIHRQKKNTVATCQELPEGELPAQEEHRRSEGG